MSDRKELHIKLKEILGSDHVYYNPPESIKMEYPAIVYSRNDVDVKRANNKKYIGKNRYEIIVIDRKPDNPAIDKLLSMPMCSYDRPYTADKLNHDVLTLYY